MAALMDATRATVLAFWLASGALPHQAEALTRMAIVESGPLAYPPRTGRGHCLYQWVGARWTRLRTWARTPDCPPLTAQLAFARTELHEPYFSCFWRAPPGSAYVTLRRTFGAGARCR